MTDAFEQWVRQVRAERKALERVRQLALANMATCSHGEQTDIDSIWPSQILAAIAGVHHDGTPRGDGDHGTAPGSADRGAGTSAVLDARTLVPVLYPDNPHTSIQRTGSMNEAEQLERVAAPIGLCGDRSDHRPHLAIGGAPSGGDLWCHADQTARLPFAAEQRRRGGQ